MASSPALIFHDDGRVEATQELMKALHLLPGSRLEFVQRDGDHVQFRVPRDEGSDSWLSLRGILADTTIDLNGERRKERERELASEKRWRE